MSLSPEQIQFYRDEGYILLENIIAPNNLVRVREKISEFLERSREVSASNALFDLDPGHSPVTPMVRRLKDPHRVDPLFADLCRCDEILDPVADLLGGTVRFDHSKLNFKPAHSNAAIQWHQDWGFYPYTNDDLLAVGVMIEDCTHDNGPLMVIPGSHRGPIYNHHHDGIFAGGIDRTILKANWIDILPNTTLVLDFSGLNCGITKTTATKKNSKIYKEPFVLKISTS